MPFLGQGFFELFIATQAPQCRILRTPRKVRKPPFPQGIPVCVSSLEKSTHRNLSCKSRPAVMYHIGQTGIWLHWAIHWPLPLPWIRLKLLLPGLWCHPTAGPHRLCLKRFFIHLKASEFPMAQKKSVSICGISFLLVVYYVLLIYSLGPNMAHSNFTLMPQSGLKCRLKINLMLPSPVMKLLTNRFYNRLFVWNSTSLCGVLCCHVWCWAQRLQWLATCQAALKHNLSPKQKTCLYWKSIKLIICLAFLLIMIYM